MKAGKKAEIQVEGKSVALYTLINKKGISVDITNYGAKIVRLYVPDKNGNPEDVVLGFDTLEEYLEKEPYFGAVCGRVANRIKDGKFMLDGKEYKLAVNNGTNHLHGGNIGYNARIWDFSTIEENKLSLRYLSPDGEEGYPGNLDITVTYELTEENELKIHYEATTDKPTIVALTQHSYFNLKGAGNGTICDNLLQLNADFYTVLDDSFAPTGEIRPVQDSAFDFRTPVLISDRIDDEAFVPGKGLDNNWCIKKFQMHELACAGFVYDPASGRKMEVYTTQPGIQVYSANWVDKQVAKDGKTCDMRGAICMETQGFPNSANVPFFPSPVLRPGEKYDEWCIYKFSIE
ncbi:MAG: galactose mutarotase [Candidatus Azobacteroides sp.]|nr:galactose mutarotase [Candidatus Azobacteroides sp.]